jgi:hypothetical protein
VVLGATLTEDAAKVAFLKSILLVTLVLVAVCDRWKKAFSLIRISKSEIRNFRGFLTDQQ